MSEHLRAAIAKFGAPVGSSSGHDVAFKCPKCAKPKLYCSKQNGAFYCFACEHKGKLGTRSTKRYVADPDSIRQTLPPTLEDIDAIPAQRGDEPWEYLVLDRGIPARHVADFQVAWSEHRGPVFLRIVDGNGKVVERERKWTNLQDCIIFPVYDGGYKGYQLRNMDPDCEKHKRWLSAPGTPRSRLLYNADQAFQQSMPPVLVEGITDALAVGPRAFATFGKNVADPQFARMIDLLEGRDLIIAFDGDAQYEGEVLAERLAQFGVSCRLAHFEGEEDPASVDDLEYRLRTAAPPKRRSKAKQARARARMYSGLFKL